MSESNQNSPSAGVKPRILTYKCRKCAYILRVAPIWPAEWHLGCGGRYQLIREA